MHRVDRDYLSICISVAIKTMRPGKNGKFTSSIAKPSNNAHQLHYILEVT